jgi:hypothetical protein
MRKCNHKLQVNQKSREHEHSLRLKLIRDASLVSNRFFTIGRKSYETHKLLAPTLCTNCFHAETRHAETRQIASILKHTHSMHIFCHDSNFILYAYCPVYQPSPHRGLLPPSCQWHQCPGDLNSSPSKPQLEPPFQPPKGTATQRIPSSCSRFPTIPPRLNSGAHLGGPGQSEDPMISPAASSSLIPPTNHVTNVIGGHEGETMFQGRSRSFLYQKSRFKQLAEQAKIEQIPLFFQRPALS